MATYFLRSLVRLAITVIGVVTVAFFLMRAIPGDPALYILGDYATKESVAALHVKLGLDRSMLEQYGLFVRGALSGDLGKSVVTGEPALDEILHGVPASLWLTLASMAIAIAFGLPLGIMSATRQGSWVDIGVMVGALAGISFPVFWLGLLGILVFSYRLDLFPALGFNSSAGFWESLYYLALPALVLGLSVTAYIARLTRSAMLEVLNQDYVRLARAMGVPERRIVYRLALRNAMVPILAVIGVTFAWSLGNAILVEAVFSRPGLGTTILKAVMSRDYQLVQAGLLVLATAIVVVNAVVELAYGFIDPRVRTL